jgi:hypothetical protein
VLFATFVVKVPYRLGLRLCRAGLLGLIIFAACANFWDKTFGCARAKSAKGAKFRIIVFLIFFAYFAFFARDLPILVAALPRWAFVVKKFFVDGCSTVIKLAQAAE